MASDAPAPSGPPARRRRGPAARAWSVLVSPRLAIALLVGVLACCLVGVTVVRDARAWELIFSTLWFNALLVLLALSSGAAFFSRIWKRRLTLVSAGLILFHLSFVALLGGAVYDSLFHFKGALRLTEGETLPNDRPESYDRIEAGRFFDMKRLRGETTLVRMHTGYRVGGEDKRAAYEIAVGTGASRVQGVIYVTEHLDVDGVRYFTSKEGYSVLVIVTDRSGQELYGAHVPLQSLRQEGGGFFYTTGSATEMASMVFPQPPAPPRMDLVMTYQPGRDARQGEVHFYAQPLAAGAAEAGRRDGAVPVGGTFDAGEVRLTPREIRYWVGMDVRYDPGLVVILTSLCVGLGGMVLAFAGRLRQGAARSKGGEDGRSGAPPRGEPREGSTT